MLFYLLLVRLVQYGGHDVGENAELVEVPDFNAYVESEMNLVLVKLKNEGDTLHAITHELR